MEGQRGNWLFARNFDGEHSFTVTKQVDNRDIFAEIALASTDGGSSGAYIAQTVSDSGVEDFDRSKHRKNVIYRENVTSITFKVEANESETIARWMIYYWS
jgi:hypothetical protein